jgi:cyclic pyranopterin phosphate synthase
MEDCSITVEWASSGQVVIECAVRATHKTGVEMEALTGAAVAALTVYDMCKALSHGIRIAEIKLISKTGGKRDFAEPSDP